MNLRSFARKIIRTNGGISAVRNAFSFARYGPGYEGKPVKHNTHTPTSETITTERRKRLSTFIPKETAKGKEHRLTEESKRMKHRKELTGAGKAIVIKLAKTKTNKSKARTARKNNPIIQTEGRED